jgi:DNA-binding CsgD family transcriptional regulator
LHRGLLSSARRDILDLCDAAAAPLEFMRAAGPLLSRTLACDAWIMHAVEPSTFLPCHGVHELALPKRDNWEIARREFLEPDINNFTKLARSPLHAAALGLTTSGEPKASARFRDFLRPIGIRDELRATFVADSACWGVATFVRKGSLPFSAADQAFIASLSQPIGRTLRRLAWLDVMLGLPRFAPCVVILDDRDRIEQASADAQAWLNDLRVIGPLVERSLPLVFTIVAHRARALATAGEVIGDFRRLRTTSGSWVSLRGTRLRRRGAARGHVGVIIEPAPPGEIAEFMLTGYRLTSREKEIAMLLAHGRASKDIAHALQMSMHTVRDHVKAVLDKVGVHTRAELIARLFVSPSFAAN